MNPLRAITFAALVGTTLYVGLELILVHQIPSYAQLAIVVVATLAGAMIGALFGWRL